MRAGALSFLFPAPLFGARGARGVGEGAGGDATCDEPGGELAPSPEASGTVAVLLAVDIMSETGGAPPVCAGRPHASAFIFFKVEA